MLFSLETYRQQLNEFAQPINEFEARQNPRSQRRLRDLKHSCSLLADGFDQFDQLISRYVGDVPVISRSSDAADCYRFLQWLESRSDLTEEQRDFIVHQQSHQAVEFVALKQRLAHLRFQELLKTRTPFNPHSAEHLSQVLHLNPIHVWASFETRALLDDEQPIPATVLFYYSRDGVQMRVISEAERELIRELEQHPQQLRALIRQCPKEEREPLLQIISKLLEAELIALSH